MEKHNFRLAVRGIGVISSLGHDMTSHREAHVSGTSQIRQNGPMGTDIPQAPLHPLAENLIQALLQQLPKYKHLDRTALLAILASRDAFTSAGWNQEQAIAVNIGSSRGATSTWEEQYSQYYAGLGISPRTSPLTTAGNISSRVAHDLHLQGVQIDHSVTCGTGLQAVANAFAWLGSGMADAFLAGAAEAALTPFTLAQLQALGIYSTSPGTWPCMPCYAGEDKSNTLVLGEAAITLALERHIPGNKALAVISGIGFGTEFSDSLTGISRHGDAFGISMKNALDMAGISQPDLVIVHSPGTIHGDRSEYHALQQLFSNNIPPVFSNKWLTGHTFAASGLMSVVSAIAALNGDLLPQFPYPTWYHKPFLSPENILINAMGFGGNAVSVIVSKT